MVRRTAFLLAFAVMVAGCKDLKGAMDASAKSAGVSSPPSASAGGWTHASVTDDLTGACTIPVHTDDYAGFDIGLPKGWEIDYSNGTIEVTKDSSGMTGAVVYPARLRHGDIPAETVADVFAHGLSRAIAQRGGTFGMSDKSTDRHIAHAQASATLSGVSLRGNLQVVSEKGFATVKLYWAPADKFDAEEPDLKQIVTCFHRQMIVVRSAPAVPAGGHVTKIGANGHPVAQKAPVTGLKPFQSKYFVGQMPDGWKITNENANGIDLVSADGQEVAGFGWVLHGTQPLQQMVDGGIHRFHPQAKILSSGPVATQQPNQVAYAAEWEGPIAHGYDEASRGPQAEVMTSMGAALGKWEAMKPTLTAIVQSIQITPNAVSQVQANVRAMLATLPRAQPSPPASAASSSSSSSPMSQWDAQDKENQKFDDAIRGQDRATSPSTGTEYTVPYNAWNAAGPQGPGYYRITPGGNTELLDVQQ